MAFVLKLYDGITTVDFMLEDYLLANGGLKIPPLKKKQVWGGNSNYANGAQLIATTFDNREVDITFQVTGTTRDELANRITALERLLDNARKHQMEQVGSRVELQYRWDGASQVTYFEVIDGDLTWPEDTMSVEQVHQRTGDNRFVIYDFQLQLTCAPFTYPISPVNGSLTSVPLTNRNGSNVTTGLKVWNHNDTGTGHDDYVEVAAASVDGEIGSLVKLQLKGDSGEAEKTGKIYIGVRKGSQSFKHILEDNAAEYVDGSPTPTNDPDYSSGGTYTTISHTWAGNVNPVTLIRWALTDTETANTQGPFRFFGRCKDNTFWDKNANYRIRIVYGANNDSLYESEWRKPVDTITELLDFGTIYMPPWLVGAATSLAGLKIEIQAKPDTATTTISIKLDYLNLMPQDGGYRVLEYRVQGLPQTEYLVDDGWEDVVYHLNSSGKRLGLPFALMPRIVLVPNILQRFYFLQEGTSKSTEITRQLKVFLYLVPEFNVLA